MRPTDRQLPPQSARRRGIIDRIEDRLVQWSPAARRRAAVQTFVWSVVLMFVNSALYLFGVIDESDLIFVTLVLSWLAITFTAADLVATTDVRKTDAEKEAEVDG